jgi:CrcB protein
MSPNRPESSAEAVDPDVDLHVPAQRRELRTHRSVVPVIALGGMVGASARHALELAWHPAPDAVPWATLVTNVSGCLLIGLLMVHVVEGGRAHPLLRPFVGVGVLGGYTTFSTYTAQTRDLLAGGHGGLALGYLFGTLASALLAVVLGVAAGRALLAGRRRLAHHRGGPR